MVPAREHVLVDERLWAVFHKRWRQIEREWRCGLTMESAQDPGIFGAIAMAVNAERAALRAEVKALAPNYPGSYLVPV